MTEIYHMYTRLMKEILRKNQPINIYIKLFLTIQYSRYVFKNYSMLQIIMTNKLMHVELVTIRINFCLMNHCIFLNARKQIIHWHRPTKQVNRVFLII